MTGRRKTLEILMRARMRSPNNTSIPLEASRHASPPTTSSPISPRSAEVGRANPVRDANVGKDVRGLMHACVSSTAESTLEEFLQNYYDLPSEGRRELLLSLARYYDVDRARVRVLMQQYLSLTPPCSGDVEDQAMTGCFGEDSAASAFYRLERNLCAALKPKYGDFVENLNAHPGGLKLLVDMRADLLSMLKVKNMAPLRSFNSFLKEKLITWLGPATLELHHITWDDSASLLEKIVAYEAVHPIRNLLDLKRRLSPGRRCFGYLHPAIPGEPLIFIEVALLKNIAQSIEEVLWDSPPISEKEATCALFYSISSTQAGLSGINLGKFIIKRVIELMRREMPHVSIFATLSPIPGFMQWLRSKLHHYLKPFDSTPEGSMQEESCSTFSEDILNPEEERSLIDACLDHITGESGMEIMQKLFSSTKNQWAKNDDLLTALKPILMRLCARYLLKEKKRGKALDVVANFHLQNGATIERINWMADPSENGLYQSGGIMVNYVYRPNIIEENAQSYSRSGIIQASDNLRFCVEKNS